MSTLHNQVAIVTGASSGIGKATARLFSKVGASVVLTARSESDLNATAKGLEGEVLVIPADVTKDSGRKYLIKKATDEFKRIDILVNAAGIIMTGTIENTSLEDWDRMFDINVRSVFHLMQLSLPFLSQTKGNIVNVSSVTGLRAFPGALSYCASKAAVDQLTRCASLELASKGIRVNAVNPGVIRTELHKRGGMDEEAYNRFLEHSAKETHPLGRVGKPEEVAELILFLASEKAAWITGVTYSIDGGRGNTCFR
jgi:NAD(P)-dependent dehydrogenase (short-subunit alcohol dehydrogenase family)